MSRGARDLLREADAIRSRADELAKFADLAEPGVRLGISCGTFHVHSGENILLLIQAARTAAGALRSEAAALEAHVQVKP
jgi:hypothetical protein